MRSFNRRTLLNEARGGTESDNSLHKDTENNIAQASLSTSGNGSIPFEVGLVEEVISNPYDYFNRELPTGQTFNNVPITVGDVFSGRVVADDAGETLSSPYTNSSVVDYAPANSIIAFLNSQKSGGAAGKPILCFPFFSSHLMLPVKPGETVWIMKFSSNVYYWFCRQSSFRQIEDVNFTFSQREENISKVKGALDENVYTHFKGNGLNVQSILNSSIALGEEFTGEPVPRQVKDCGDFLIQGSNNSHIYLGKEKFEEVSTVSQETFTSATSPSEANPNRRPISPAIDLCVLRKANEIFEIKSLAASNNLSDSLSVSSDDMSVVSAAQNPSVSRFYENEKTRELLEKEIFPEEFYDSDIHNCIARIYMTNAITIDEILLTPDYLGEPDMSASPQDITGVGNYGTMVALGSNARLVGTETIKVHNIAGSSGIQFTPEGDVIVFANTEGGAKIVLEAAGDIRIVPGENGILKLGSDTPDGVPIGGTLFESPSAIPGNVAYTPATTTSGGLIADPLDLERANPVPGIPKYSSKVLFS